MGVPEPPQPSRGEGSGMKVYAARAPFGEPILSGRCKWVAPLVSLTHCAGVGPSCRKSDSGRSGMQASPGQADLGPGRAGAGKQLYGPVHSSSVAYGHRLGQRMYPHNPGYPVSWH